MSINHTVFSLSSSIFYLPWYNHISSSHSFQVGVVMGGNNSGPSSSSVASSQNSSSSSIPVVASNLVSQPSPRVFLLVGSLTTRMDGSHGGSPMQYLEY